MEKSSSLNSSYSIIVDKYPLHLAIWEIKPKILLKHIKKNGCNIEKLDPRGRSPLQLAVLLNNLECVKILLENGADVVDSLNKDGWSIIHEATSVGNSEMLQLLLQHRYYQRYIKEMKSIPQILKAIHEAPDFYFEIKWEFSSLIPLISKLCPSDTCNVWKSGPNVRIDSTLIDFYEQGINRGRRSYLFHGTGAEAKFIELDHDKKTISTEIFEMGLPLETIELELMKPHPNHVKQRLQNPIMTTYLDVDNIRFERNKAGLWGWRNEKIESINGYECKVYNALNVELITKTRLEHLADSNGVKKLSNYFTSKKRTSNDPLLSSSTNTNSNSSNHATSYNQNRLNNLVGNHDLETGHCFMSSIPLVNSFFGFKTVSDTTKDEATTAITDSSPKIYLNDSRQSDNTSYVSPTFSIKSSHKTHDKTDDINSCNTTKDSVKLNNRKAKFSSLVRKSMSSTNGSPANEKKVIKLPSPGSDVSCRVQDATNDEINLYPIFDEEINNTGKVTQRSVQAKSCEPLNYTYIPELSTDLENGYDDIFLIKDKSLEELNNIKINGEITDNLVSAIVAAGLEPPPCIKAPKKESSKESIEEDIFLDCQEDVFEISPSNLSKSKVNSIPQSDTSCANAFCNRAGLTMDQYFFPSFSYHDSTPESNKETEVKFGRKTSLSNLNFKSAITFNNSNLPERSDSSGNTAGDIGRIRKEIVSKSQTFKATLWLSEECPLSLQDQILPIIDLMPKSNAHFSKLKEFITLQLPPGFPVKIEIPLFHILNARITFCNICAKDEDVYGVCKIVDDSDVKGGRVSCIIDSCVFQVPLDYKDKNTYFLPKHNTSILNRGGTSNDIDAENALLQYAIQQSLIDEGTENDKVTVWEALKKESPKNVDHQNGPCDDASEQKMSRESDSDQINTQLKNPNLNINLNGSSSSSSIDEDEQMKIAIQISKKELKDKEKRDSYFNEEFEKILQLSLLEK
ncbi:ankyrin repeat domain-containing protein 13D-like isoform X2 [Gordionus sp. m RMFG-2023]|uniref:ankyrin repeat domain-containing protein 13D-like isoform X2 n=1 Tax=Gordionus sp. m RMFG-2023 TaxID=3053472 RepID=UPI0031FCB64A